MSKNYLNKIVVLQKRVWRLIYFVDRKEHAIPFFVNAKILLITFLYYEAVCKSMFDVYNDSAPSNIAKLFTRTSNIHNIILAHQRHNSLALSTLDWKCKKKAFSCVGVKVWNEMPNEYKNLSKKSFKKGDDVLTTFWRPLWSITDLLLIFELTKVRGVFGNSWLGITLKCINHGLSISMTLVYGLNVILRE